MERRAPELQPLRGAMDHAQALWAQLSSLSDDDPRRPDLVAELDSVQKRILALRVKHGL